MSQSDVFLHGAWMACFSSVLATPQPEASQPCGLKGANRACDSTISHLENFLRLEGLWTLVRLLMDEQDV